ncbi:conserved hypothetical protein [Candidatus Desulfarcum epimagneticum]|uniref:site-specific DNA-methyltransferase (adenine-specific) n=1 Tax=uncultured Desulfobacteraceae bacterium TaxID=218296 RepID=A0A484HHM4_9BACT|nr:conserved hypothetical protein [uncultured Desulfobacteraceae bacterium]
MDSDSIVIKKQEFFSPLRYPGGKAGLSSFFFKVIEENHISDCTYIEPYAGGAGAALTLLFLEKVAKIIINDIDISIYAFWKSILRNTKRFIDKTNKTEVTVEEWKRQREIYKNKHSSIFSRGFATFFLNRTNRSGIIEARPIGGMNQTGKWKIDARFNKKNLIKRIERIALYESRINFSKIDGIELMKKIHKMPNILVYIDPPYFKKGNTLYFNYYDRDNHVELSNFLNSNPNFDWLLTYDNVPEIINLYPNREKATFNLHYHVNTAKKSQEILIKSDNITIP